ncbi:MAG: hypothetical protein EZS28_016434 [Streblomastix strix]|uniref:Uncharacterized protein n=1 Tax=Streblomastix strix TaxID=222440 RepID=A0A5J4VZP0_9EUKA|nr:MAG: hypothetical protein EZS28_016434 [Streblomastix strix]
MKRSWMWKRKGNNEILVAAVAVIVNKHKKIGKEKEIRQFRECMEMDTDWKMMNATVRQTKERQIDFKREQQTINFNYISTQHNRPHKSLLLHSQQHSPSPTLDESLAVLRNISLRDSQEHKEKEPDQKEPSLQQYAGLMDVVERFHEIIKLQVEKEKKKSKIMLPGYCTKYPNKDCPVFFYPPKNYHLTPICRLKDQSLLEKLWNQTFEMCASAPFLIVFDYPTTSKLRQIYQSDHTTQDYQTSVMEWQDSLTFALKYQSKPEAVTGLIIFATEQIVNSETESKDQEQFTNELERIVADGTDDNGDDDQSEHAIELKHFIN